jgi:hypothetical protein
MLNSENLSERSAYKNVAEIKANEARRGGVRIERRRRGGAEACRGDGALIN